MEEHPSLDDEDVDDDANDDSDDSSRPGGTDLPRSLVKPEVIGPTVAAHRLYNTSAGPRFLEKAFVGVVGVVGVVAGYFGGIALWIWAMALLNEHWGFFWAALAFCTIFFALVVVVTCFAWGVPYFFFAFLTWIAAIFAMSRVETSKKSSAIGLCAVLAFAGTGGYLAWKDAVTPDPITGRVLDRLTDDALAVIAVLRSTQSTDDAEAAVASTRARGRLREELRKYDVSRMDAIEKMVAQYLNFEKSMERDLVAFLEGRVHGREVAFTIGPSTRAALQTMPERFQRAFSADTDDLAAINMLFDDRVLDEVPDNWREMMTFALKKKWRDYGAAYEDVMGRPIPNPK